MSTLCSGPFTQVVTADLHLKNPSDKRVCFRVKTTVPKRYCVGPNSGIIEPRQPITVAGIQKYEHKFMVQTMFAPDGKIDNQDQLWRDASPDKLIASKLKSVFDPTGNTVASSPAPIKEEKAMCDMPWVTTLIGFVKGMIDDEYRGVCNQQTLKFLCDQYVAGTMVEFLQKFGHRISLGHQDVL
ncbi:hypothetical protein DPMN_178178 [Dreissena polymorpha]|uniref:MSP domain-containing protein n=1 Tax=Dreissena polymorpha TaxID=45954 RepID=A0A9D4EBJ6_DREPO|nr:hypothetical protein DPMN_178178 [Dreissena polymorpha]